MVKLESEERPMNRSEERSLNLHPSIFNISSDDKEENDDDKRA